MFYYSDSSEYQQKDYRTLSHGSYSYFLSYYFSITILIATHLKFKRPTHQLPETNKIHDNQPPKQLKY